ncbi:uncharacterized protein LOC129379721 [Poeciliopsis prolifica]|uniref:uncharacterized protein LOC129379721 n=1 Tax=Poeciliopsis prolifica TaxID=188132 RepID=UPI0024131412|nr:uncharacterized protein LOC129379721 [Poeciliopsis prolifica]
MAGLRGLMILLVLMVGLARCKDNTTVNTSPASTSNETPNTNQSSSETKLSPASTSNETPNTNQSSSQTNTTMTPTTAQPKPDPKCSYSVETIEFGLKIQMTDFTPNNFTVYVAEIRDSFERKGNFNTSKNSTYVIKPLKPCTEYELKVTFSDSNGAEISCNSTKDKTTTTGMTDRDIKKASCPPGYFCYQSDWNINSLLSENNKVSIEDFKNGSYRFKHVYDDMCSDLVLTFPESCSNATFTKSENFTVDFIDPKDINQTKPDKLPAEIIPKFPSRCKNLSVDYKCSGE